jgi:hypothetical protein
MTATSLAISSAANAQAIAANAAAQEAANKACMVFVRGYEHDSANETEMREYVGCIQRLYPYPAPDSVIIVGKVGVLFLFVCIIIGIFLERKNQTISEGWFGAVLVGGALGLCFGGLGLIFLILFVFGVRFLFS